MEPLQYEFKDEHLLDSDNWKPWGEDNYVTWKQLKKKKE